MDDRQKTIEFLDRLAATKPWDMFRRLDDKERGMGIILHMLALSNGEVIAGDIATKLHMSTPRVSAALKTLERKGFVERKTSESDRRKTVVAITDAGREKNMRMENAVITRAEHILKTVGEDTMEEFLVILSKIGAAHKAFVGEEA